MRCDPGEAAFQSNGPPSGEMKWRRRGGPQRAADIGLPALVDVTGEPNVASQIAFGGADRSRVREDAVGGDGDCMSHLRGDL